MAGFTLSYSHAVTPSKYHTFCCALKTLSLIIAPNLEDGHRPNLLVLLSNHLIPNDYTVDHRPNLLVQLCNHLILNDYTVERSRRRSFHCLSGKNLVLLKSVTTLTDIPADRQTAFSMTAHALVDWTRLLLPLRSSFPDWTRQMSFRVLSTIEHIQSRTPSNGFAMFVFMFCVLLMCFVH